MSMSRLNRKPVWESGRSREQTGTDHMNCWRGSIHRNREEWAVRRNRMWQKQKEDSGLVQRNRKKWGLMPRNRETKKEGEDPSVKQWGGGSVNRNRESEDPSKETERDKGRERNRKETANLCGGKSKHEIACSHSLYCNTAIPMCSAKLAGSEIALYVWFLHWYQVCEIAMLN